jgi:hypothetical protein
MKKLILFFCFITLNALAQRSNTSVQFVGYQTISFEKGKQGGISGVEYNTRDDKWYMGSDKGMSDVFTFRISYDENGINPPIKIDSFDLGAIRNIEAMRLDTSNRQDVFVMVNEPDEDDSLAHIYTWNTTEKEARSVMKMPKNLYPFKHNKGFEGLTLDKNGNYWLASEQSIERDGTRVRFSHIDKNTQQVIEQYAFEYDSKTCKDNGISEILMLDEHRFLVLDRCFDGCKAWVKLFEASITDNTVNTKDKETVANLLPTELMTKTELLNINDVLFPDNLEGMAWGKPFADGSRALIIVSDDNLRKKAPQISQILLFKVK